MEAELQCTAFCSRRLTHRTIVCEVWWAQHGRVMGAARALDGHGVYIGVRVIRLQILQSLKQNEALLLHAFLEVTSQDGNQVNKKGTSYFTLLFKYRRYVNDINFHLYYSANMCMGNTTKSSILLNTFTLV